MLNVTLLSAVVARVNESSLLVDASLYSSFPQTT